MKFSIGDKVVFKHTDGEGVVTGYVNSDMVEVEMDGVSFPVHTDEIDHPYLKWFTEKKIQPQKKTVPEQLPVEKEKFRRPRLAKGVYLSFIPEYKLVEMEEQVSSLKVYLLNELPTDVQLRYEVELKGATAFAHEGRLHSFGHIYLHTLPYDQMNDLPRFNWWLDDTSDPATAPASGTVRIKPQKLFQHISECMSGSAASFEFRLLDEFVPLAVEKAKSRMEKIEPPVVPAKEHAKNVAGSQIAPTVIDLHIENLLPSTRGMSNADIIITQLAALRDALRMAINSRQERLVVVHGLGTGKLKTEVHKVLEDTIEVKSYTNEWQAGYGFGATEVWFQY